MSEEVRIATRTLNDLLEYCSEADPKGGLRLFSLFHSHILYY